MRHALKTLKSSASSLQSSNGIHLTLAADEGSAPSNLAAQLVQLIRTSLNSTESLAKAPLIELLKRQAEQVPATAYQQTIPVWQLAGAKAVPMRESWFGPHQLHQCAAAHRFRL